jgi:glutamyl-tRNA synthetase
VCTVVLIEDATETRNAVPACEYVHAYKHDVAGSSSRGKEPSLTLEDFERRYPPRTALPSGAEVTRIAPSPTGRPHIGTALQAVINRALATKTGGVFIIRIEDTDQARLVPGVVDEILAGLDWLGTAPDEGPSSGGEHGPYVQSERLDLYRTAADWLVEHGHAYHCFCSAERLEAVRTSQVAQLVKPMYDRHCRSLTGDEVASRQARGEPSAIRMKIPDGESIRFSDLARGEIAIHSGEIDDAVVLKTDGFPTYHLASVVDDHFMRITTVVRGEEWISSTPKHVLLFRYFGWTPPRFLHTALLRDPQGRKLSKRSGDTSLSFFAAQGILSTAFRNFLTRIIWSHPDQKDVYDFAEFIALFRESSLSVAGPVVDYALLIHLNGQYLRQLAPEALYEAVDAQLSMLISEGRGFQDELGSGAALISHDELLAFRAALHGDRPMALRMLALEPERFKRTTDVIGQCRFYFATLFQAPPAEKLLTPLGDAAVLGQFLKEYDANHDRIVGSKESWDGYLRAYAQREQVKAGKIFMALRLVVTGSEMSPPLFEILHVLGAAEVHRRVALALARISG